MQAILFQGTNGQTDSFMHDRETGITTRISVATDGSQGNSYSYDSSVSDDGRCVAFNSNASNLVANDLNNGFDVFARCDGVTSLASVSSAGVHGEFASHFPSISANGRYVGFISISRNLVPVPLDENLAADVFVHDLDNSETIRVSLDSAGSDSDGRSELKSISSDGRFVGFDSVATDLVASDSNGVKDAFVRDLSSGVTYRVSVDSSGIQGDNESSSPSISDDGRFAAFQSYAANLAVGDNNGNVDIYLRDLALGRTSLISTDRAGTIGSGHSLNASISVDGGWVAFDSTSGNVSVRSRTSLTRPRFRI
jgi:hypothetical protein